MPLKYKGLIILIVAVAAVVLVNIKLGATVEGFGGFDVLAIDGQLLHVQIAQGRTLAAGTGSEAGFIIEFGVRQGHVVQSS